MRDKPKIIVVSEELTSIVHAHSNSGSQQIEISYKQHSTSLWSIQPD
jgi:hypothetical protein